MATSAMTMAPKTMAKTLVATTTLAVIVLMPSADWPTEKHYHKMSLTPDGNSLQGFVRFAIGKKRWRSCLKIIRDGAIIIFFEAVKR